MFQKVLKMSKEFPGFGILVGVPLQSKGWSQDKWRGKKSISQGGGPQFIEFDTYRWREHCGPNYDNDLGYREESEFLYWKKKDPLKVFYTNNPKEYIDKKIQKINKEINNAHSLADHANYPSIKDYNKAFNGN